MFGEEQRRSHAAADFKDDRRSRDGPDREGRLEATSTSKTVAEAAASTPRKDEGDYEGDDRRQRDRHHWNTSPERYSVI